MMPQRTDAGPRDRPIALVLSDIDGTLITSDRVLTDSTVAAVQRLQAAGIVVALTSGRPPRGMAMILDKLTIDAPIAAFNGGIIVDAELNVLRERLMPGALVGQMLDSILASGLSAFVYQGTDWYVQSSDGPHVDREATTVQFEPTVVADFAAVLADGGGITKLVGVSDDLDLVARVESAIRDQFGAHVSAARSQPYYLDITHPEANKGSVAQYLAQRYRLDTAAIATIGDMPNDVLMFAHSGLGIAMGNASLDVQRAARRVTTANDADGFAHAVDRFILPTLVADRR